MGFLGILETGNRDHVPGTVILNEQAAHSEDITHGLKHVGKIVLVPQPSNDLNDPLNWSLAKKRAVFTIVLFGTSGKPLQCSRPLMRNVTTSSCAC
jgi:hypothetical protein